MRRLPLLLGLAGALVGAAPVPRRVTLPDPVILGRDATGEPCSAARNWRDPRLGNVFDQAWSLSCRGVSASRPQGFVLRLRDTGSHPIDPKACGAAATQTLAGIGPVAVQACYDAALGQATVVRFTRHGESFTGAATSTALGPLEALLRAAVLPRQPLVERDATVKPTLDGSGLKLPATRGASHIVRDFNPAISLQAGISLNQRGLYVEASRLLNDALSRLYPDTPVATRVELELEAALADSNISQFDAADDHFARAASLLHDNTDLDRAATLESKRATYRGLDLLNRREWTDAIAEMADKDAAKNPLQDPAMLSRLNQASAGAGNSAATSSADPAQLSRLLLEAQRNWARSVALLAIGKGAESRAALAQAIVYVDQLERSVRPEAVVPIKARVQRQAGRIEAREGHVDAAIAAFDCAIGTLQGAAPDPAKPCTMSRPAARARPAALAVDGPLIAETELERASVLARKPGISEKKVLADYDVGVDALIASSATGGIVPPSLEGYLDTLTAIDAKQHGEELAEKFFRALQAVGEPAIARQLAQLQTVVTADSSLGAKVRDRAEIEREVVRLRYAIASADAKDQPALAALDQQRASAEGKLDAINLQISRDGRFRAVDDRPATVAEMRRALRPGEIYLKLSRLRTRAYGIAITPERSFIYTVAASGDDLDRITRRVRDSIRGSGDRLPFFDVPAAFTLFRLIAGPAEASLLRADALVVDTAGVLQNVPASVLIADRASVQHYAARRAAAPNDYSDLAFLGRRAEISNALSPRSFLIARALPQSAAPRPFIGFGENAPPEILAGEAAKRLIPFGSGCAVPYAELAAIMGAQAPISAHEIGVAAAALGDPQAPEVTGRAFTDTLLLADNDRDAFDKYQVVHFATHGLPETRQGCMVLPPALLTTLGPPAPPGEPQSDGLLSFADVAQLHLDANLVVLSACQTAAGVSGLSGRLAGQDESTASLDGLVRAFIAANARAVLATYWKVPAIAESEEFIRQFYVAGRTEPIGAALRTAQTALIRTPAFSHPYFWGAYFLVGDASKTMLTRAAPPVRTAAR